MPSSLPEPGQIVIVRQRPFVVSDIQTSTLPATKILIIPTNKLSRAAGFAQEVGIMREKELRSLRRNVKSFFSEFKASDFSSLSEATVQQCLDTHQLSVEALVADYAEKVRQ